MLRDLLAHLGCGTVSGRTVRLVRWLLGSAALVKTIDLIDLWARPTLAAAAPVPAPLLAAGAAVVLLVAWVAAGLALVTGRHARLGAGVLALEGLLAVLWGGAYANHLLFLAIAAACIAWSAPTADDTDRVPAWPLRLLQLHLCVVYLSTGVAKLNSGFLTGATLVDLADTSLLWPSPGPDPVWWLWAGLAVVTVVWELTAPVALWTRLRVGYLVAAPVFHLGMLVVASDRWQELIRLTVFGLAVAATYVPFATEPSRRGTIVTDGAPTAAPPPAWKAARPM